MPKSTRKPAGAREPSPAAGRAHKKPTTERRPSTATSASGRPSRPQMADFGPSREGPDINMEQMKKGSKHPDRKVTV